MSADYGNEECAGAAIRQSGLDRQKIYVTTKYSGGEEYHKDQAPAVRPDIRGELISSLHKVGFFVIRR